MLMKRGYVNYNETNINCIQCRNNDNCNIEFLVAKLKKEKKCEKRERKWILDDMRKKKFI